MATVAESRHTWLLVLALLLASSAVFATGFISSCDMCKATQIYLKLDGYTLYSTLVLYNTTMDISYPDLNTLQQSYDYAQQGQTADSYNVLTQEGLNLDGFFSGIKKNTSYIENGEIYFYYFETHYDDAQQKSVSTRVDIECLEPDYPRLTNAGGVANCTLPNEVYKDNCNMVYASFCDPGSPTSDICQKVKPSSAQLYICGEKTDAISNLSAIIKDNLALPAPTCFLFIILGGLLLASMFFSGRSPLSLLDITTPLLPKAKTISYSGISMGTGITRMGRMADLMVKEIENSSQTTYHDLMKFYRSSTGFNARLLALINDSASPHSMKMIALRALISGRGENDVRKILGVKNAGDMNAVLGDYLASFKANPNAELNRLNKLDDQVTLLAQKRILIEMQKDVFWRSTGEVPKGFFGKVKSTVGNLPIVGDHIRGGTASAFFGAKQTGKLYSSFLRGAARASITDAERKRIQMSVDAKRAVKKPVGLFEGMVALSKEEKSLVALFNIYEKGDALYKRKMQEAKNDVLNWLVRKVLKQYGATLDLDEEKVLEIGFKDAKELMFASLKAKDFERIEAELRKILSEKGSEYDRAYKIMRMMDNLGISYDRDGVRDAIKMLQRIENEIPKNYPSSKDADFDNKEWILNSHKLIRLQKYLEEQFKVNQLIDLNREFGDRFFFSVGRPDLKYSITDAYGNQHIIDHTFSTYFLTKYRQQLEQGEKPGQKPISFLDVANYCFLRVVNERWGLMDPNTPGLRPDIQFVMLKAREWLISLANPGAFKDVKDMNQLLGGLYTTDTRAGLPGRKDAIGVAGHGFEHGPMEGVWRMDMKAQWRTLGGAMGGARTTVENQSYKEVYNSHTMPPGVRNIAESQKVSQEKALQIYLNQVVARNLFERMKGIIEQENPNTYFSSQREFDHFHSILASYKEFIARKQNRKEYEISDAEVEKFIRAPLGVRELGEDSWIRLREGSWVPFSQKHSFKLAQADRVVNAMAYVKQDGVWKEFMPEKLLSDGLFRKKIGMLGEFEDILPANNEVLKRYQALLQSFKNKTVTKADVESFIAKVADFASIESRDPRKVAAYNSLLLRLSYDTSGEFGKEVKKKIEEMGVLFDKRNPRLAGTAFGDSMEGNVLARNYMEAASSEDRKKAIEGLKSWARQGSPQDNRQMKVALLFYNTGTRSNDMRDFNSYEDGIRIAPMGMKSFTTDTGRVEEVGGARNWLRQAFKPVHMEFEQFLMSSFAKQTKNEYESSLISEYFRETGARFSGKLLAGEFGNVQDRSNPTMQAYNRLADAFGKYHAIWDEAITRDPRGNSSAIGHAFVFSSFFHHGPAMPFGPAFYRRYTTPGFSKSWYSGERLSEGFRSLQWTPQMFNWMLAGPFIGGYRTLLTSKLGYPSKYDRNYIQSDDHSKMRDYNFRMQGYDNAVSEKAKQFESQGIASTEAWSKARDESRSLMPEAPSFGLQRDTLDPFSMSSPRNKDAWRSFTNWFYASFDPTSTNLKRNFARIASPLASFLPFSSVHGKLLDQEWHFADSYRNPYYVSPGGVRGAMLKTTGPMIKRQYGGTEIMTGVVRAPEDMWAFQAGVNVIWGNANPGASYVDFSNTLQMDPRAANHLRYESRFRPFFEHDEYIGKQANLGIAKREIDPTRMMLERNQELRGYRFPDNRLYAFLAPATLAGYGMSSYLKRGKRFLGDVREFAEGYSGDGLSTYDGSDRGVGVYGGYGLGKGMQFFENKWSKTKLTFTSELRYCSCGSAMPADGACPACSKKIRCQHCQSVVNPGQTHICQHGLRRNIIMDEMQQNGILDGMNAWKNVSKRWGREA